MPRQKHQEEEEHVSTRKFKEPIDLINIVQTSTTAHSYPYYELTDPASEPQCCLLGPGHDGAALISLLFPKIHLAIMERYCLVLGNFEPQRGDAWNPFIRERHCRESRQRRLVRQVGGWRLFQ